MLLLEIIWTCILHREEIMLGKCYVRNGIDSKKKHYVHNNSNIYYVMCGMYSIFLKIKVQ